MDESTLCFKSRASPSPSFISLALQNSHFIKALMISIRKASPDDAQLLTILAREIYKEHYLYLWLPGGAEWYLEYTYSSNKINDEVTDPAVEYFIAFENDDPIGYMKLVSDAYLQGGENLPAMEVERIYIRKSSAGKGLGKQLMDLAMQKARALKKEIIFLKAMDSGGDAIAFYKRLGYVVCGSLQLPVPEFALMKPGFRGMVLLKKCVE